MELKGSGWLESRLWLEVLHEQILGSKEDVS